MPRLLLLALTALAMSGCMSLEAQRIRRAELMLSDAGFQIRAADTPDTLAYLHSLTPRTLLVGSWNGQLQYVYAEPAGCKCLYVGTESQYQELLRLQRNEAAVSHQVRDIRRLDALGELWRRPTPPLQ